MSLETLLILVFLLGVGDLAAYVLFINPNEVQPLWKEIFPGSGYRAAWKIFVR